MNSAFAEMLHCSSSAANFAGVKGMEMSVLERQRMVLKWQQEQVLQIQQPQQEQSQSYFNELDMLSFIPTQAHNFQGLETNCSLNAVTTSPIINGFPPLPVKADPGTENRWNDFELPKSELTVDSSGMDSAALNYAISRTASCPPYVAAAAATSTNELKGRESLTANQKLSAATGRESFKKRKAEKNLSPKVDEEEDSRSKKSRRNTEEGESKITEQTSNRNSNTVETNQKESNEVTNDNKSKEASGCTSKDNSKTSEVQKPDYIHVRARRGQATDSHSLAERVRREKISERMKYLQDLVPGCNKITGKAGMLDEIINYVQSLQRQVEFLSMKLATVSPRLEFNIDDLIAKEVLASCSTSLQSMGVDITNPAFLQYNPMQQMDSICGEVAVNPIDMGLRRSISAPVSVPDAYIDPSCYNVPSSSPWDMDLQNIFNMEFQQGNFPPSTFTGAMETRNLKMEM